MESRFSACEPNFLIPQDVTIEKLKEEEKQAAAKNIIPVPVFDKNASREELRETFSLNRNDYLKCKWNKFLEHVPKKVLMVKPYTEYKRKKSPVRRMILNGSYYLNCGKLIPVPHLGGQRT